MLNLIKKLICLIGLKKNWKERTSDAPKAFKVSKNADCIRNGTEWEGANVIMSSESYDSFAREDRIDQAIYDAEKEFAETGEYVDADVAFASVQRNLL